MCSTLLQGWARLKISQCISCPAPPSHSVCWAEPGYVCSPPVPSSSSSLSLIVSIWLERLPLSTVVMGSFHRGLRLEWIDRRQYPCCGKFASCVRAQCCCSSSYSSLCQDIGKSQLQLHAPSLRPAGQMWPCALHAGFRRGLCQDFLPLDISCIIPWRWFPTQLIRWFPLCDCSALIKYVDNDNSIVGGAGSRSWDVISYCITLPRWLICL